MMRVYGVSRPCSLLQQRPGGFPHPEPQTQNAGCGIPACQTDTYNKHQWFLYTRSFPLNHRNIPSFPDNLRHFNIAAFKETVNDHIVTANRNSLVQIIEIVIIIGIAHRKSLDDKSRKCCAVSSPLFFCVAFYQFFIDLAAYQADGLLF